MVTFSVFLIVIGIATYVALKAFRRAGKWGLRTTRAASDQVYKAASNIRFEVPEVPHKKTIWRLTKVSVLIWVLFFMFLPVILTIAMIS